MAQRMFKFDNLKFFLIYLVVLGHVIDVSIGSNGGLVPRFAPMATLHATIYLFHMPLFIFVSGLFAKRDEQRFPYERVVSFVMLGLLIRISMTAVSFVYNGGNISLTLFNEGLLPWYMYAMAVYTAVGWMLRRASFVPVLVLAVLLSLAVGYDSGIGTWFTLSRIIVFFPFYWMGACLKPAEVQRVVDKPWVRIIALAVLVVMITSILLNQEYFYSLRPVYTGWSSYERMGCVGYEGPLARLTVYGFALLMGFAVLALTPSGNLRALSRWGGRTLQIYALHMPIVYILRALYVGDWFEGLMFDGWYWLEAIVVSVVLTLVLVPRFWGVLLHPFTPKGVAGVKVLNRKPRAGGGDGAGADAGTGDGGGGAGQSTQPAQAAGPQQPDTAQPSQPPSA